MKSIDKITFTSPIGMETTYSNTQLGNFESTMELLSDGEGENNTTVNLAKRK